jgi:hypothetical protein
VWPWERGARYLLPRLVDRRVLAPFTGLTYRGFTCYVGGAPGPDVDAAVDLLVASCLDPALDERSVEVEAGRWDGPVWTGGSVADELDVRRHWFRDAVSEATSALYAGGPLAHDPGGVPASLRHASTARVRAFHRRWYRTGAVLRCVVDPATEQAELTGPGRGLWRWEPATVRRSLPVGGLDRAHILGWRFGLHGPAQRCVNLALARRFAALLAGGPMRQALAAEGWTPLAGPIVDPTTPDPCVLAVLRSPEQAPGGQACQGHEVVAGCLRALLAGATEPLPGVAAAAGRREPLIDDPWACLAVHALANAVMTWSSDGDPVDVRQTWADLHHLFGEDRAWQGRSDTATDRVAIREAPHLEVVHGSPVTEPAVHGASRCSARAVDGLRTVVALDAERWPRGRLALSLRWYPGQDSGWAHHLRVLPAVRLAQGAAPRLSPPALGAVADSGHVRAYAEWRWSPPSAGALRELLARLGGTPVDRGDPAAGSAPPAVPPPPPPLVAAALAGSPAAVAELALHGFGLPASRPGAVVATPEPPATDVVTVAVTGLGPQAVGDLETELLEAAARVPSWFTGSRPPQMPPAISLDAAPDTAGHWWLAPAAAGAGPAAAVHVAAAWPSGGAPGAGRVALALADLRYEWRDAGVYASGGHLASALDTAVLWVHGPRAAQAAPALADGFARALARASAERAGPAGDAPRPALPVHPPGALAGMQQELCRPDLHSRAVTGALPPGSRAPGDVVVLRAGPR